jgi:hypothetical protein
LIVLALPHGIADLLELPRRLFDSRRTALDESRNG